MKNWKRIFALALLICFAVTLIPVEAHADVLTASMVADLAYGIATSMGINFTAGSATGQGMSSFMTGQVESYVNEHGGSLGSLFAGEVSRSAAGKLLVAQNLYNGVLNFVGWLKDKYTLDIEDSVLSQGEYEGKQYPATGTGDQVPTGEGIEAIFTGYIDASPPSTPFGGYVTFDVYNGGAKIHVYTWGTSSVYGYTGSYELYVMNGSIYARAPVINKKTGDIYTYSNKLIVAKAPMTNTLSWSVPQNWGMPQPLPENKSWEGDFSGTPGFADPPTDLPDFLSRIPVAIADDTLDVVESIVDTGGNEPPPSPTPSPSPSPAPSGPKLGIAEKIGIIIGEIIGILYDTTGDTATETVEQIAEDVQDVTQTITDAITETQISTSGQTQTAIQDQTQTLTDTLTQTQTQTQTAIQDATQTLTDTLTDSQTDIKDAIQDLTDVPDQWEPQKHPLPRGVFPFCIPFDLHDLILALSAEPQTPEVHVPFDINLPLPGGRSLPFHYQFDLDLHDFDGLAQVLRTLEFIAFGVGLLFVTGKVIKW